MALGWVDHRADPAAWAASLGVSAEAVALVLDGDFLDLHVDMEVPIRLYGYDPSVRRDPTATPPRFFGHTDYPRIREAGLTGVVYDIATNPFRPERNRQVTTLANLDAAERRIGAHPEDLALCRSHADYMAARASGKTAMFLSLQGGNALAADPSVLEGEVGARLHRITLVHLTRSVLGGTSSPIFADPGLTDRGRDFVERCTAARVIVDLAHAGKKTFADVLAVHTRDVPPIVSHTGVEGVRPHWRNLDDGQLRQIADRGGVIGIMYQSPFLAPVWAAGFAPRSAVVDHLAHVIDVVGEDFVAIGTDYDGMIIPPHDLGDVTDHPRLVQDMLDRGWGGDRIRKILGLNYLRVVRDVRPGGPVRAAPALPG